MADGPGDPHDLPRFAFDPQPTEVSGSADPRPRKESWWQRFTAPRERVELSPEVEDEVKTTTCYMCACRCGVKVHLQEGRIRFIDGNRNHPVNRGVICGKGSAGIMQQYSPARLRSPLLRTGERGKGEFRAIGWDEALTIVTERLRRIRDTDPARLAFFTGRDQSQSLTGYWAAQFGTPNYAAHGGFCSVNMAAGGMYTLGGSFWEFGEPDWERARYLLLFGVAEDHDSNPIKIGLSRLKASGAKIVGINPVKTGYNAIADEWIGIRPGTDGLFALALVHELLKADRIDLDYLVRYTNAPWLVVRNPGGADDGLFARDGQGRVLAWDRDADTAVPAERADLSPLLVGEKRLPDGRFAVPVFQLMAARYLDPSYAPEAVAERCGIAAETIRRIAGEIAHVAFQQQVVIEQPWTDWAGRRHDRMIGRPVAMHAMRGISAHSNGFHTCRALHLLQLLLGSVDVPGGWRYKPPYPRPAPPGPFPAGWRGEPAAGKPLAGSPLGYPLGPEHLLVDAAGRPERLDKAFSWEYPLAVHGMLHMVITNAWAGDPYPIDTLFLYMSNMAWNSSMHTGAVMRMLTDRDPATGEYRIPFIVYSDAFDSETVSFADLVLPDTTYLERWDCISLLDRPIGSADGPADAIRRPVVAPDRDVRPFQDVLIELGVRLGLPAFANPDGSARYPGGYPDYIVNHQRQPGLGPLAGWRGRDGTEHGRGEPNPDQLERYMENDCFWMQELPPEQRFFKHANKDYLETAVRLGFIERAEPVVHQLWSEPLQRFRLAAQGFGERQPPDHLRPRIATYFDPLPLWYEPLEHEAFDQAAYPLSAITQRPMPMYHSWGSHNAWLRQIYAHNDIFMSRALGVELGLANGDWVWIASPHGRIKARLRLMEGVNRHTVWTWNAIGKRQGAWNLKADAPEAHQGFLLNHIINELLPDRGGARFSNSDPVTGQAAWYDLRVAIEPATADEAGETSPQAEPQGLPAGMAPSPSINSYGTWLRTRRRQRARERSKQP
ncbi:molybdopterin oxidoreductase family protein [Magnetospirillum sp. UT-4]|uniref:molybdopterin oxidoreductase family protein n=1 Tax=Magnetospirillum sp. UT-4 TaxID=2681467 RepID=UPI0013841380|nr:molybdopterin oxidoreductase family protein [Magnetospirillum sp. UT-4]CAA7614357.1 Molybdopterin oxidoreductase Fe4S4 region [Magnetospirillum sp. UT-4]